MIIHINQRILNMTLFSPINPVLCQYHPAAGLLYPFTWWSWKVAGTGAQDVFVKIILPRVAGYQVISASDRFRHSPSARPLQTTKCLCNDRTGSLVSVKDPLAEHSWDE